MFSNKFIEMLIFFGIVVFVLLLTTRLLTHRRQHTFAPSALGAAGGRPGV